MNIIVNGTSKIIHNPLSILDLIAEFNLDPHILIIEHNRKIISGDDLKNVILQNGDTVELIKIVGGG